MKAQRGSRAIAVLFLYNLGARLRGGVNVTPQPFYTWERDPVPPVQEPWCAPMPVWTGAENLSAAGI